MNKKMTLASILLFSVTVLAQDEILLKLRREKPFHECDISSSKVVLIKKVQGIKYKKEVSYQLDNILPVIETAYRTESSSRSSEHFAVVPDKLGNDPQYFELSTTNDGIKLINLISTLCEVRM